MLLTIWAFIKLAGYFVIDHWKVTVPVILIAIVLGWVVVSRSCGRPAAKLNEKEIQESVTAIEQKNDAKLKETLVNAAVREKNIDADVANGRVEKINAIAEAKKKYSNMNTSELAGEIEKLK